MSLPSEFNEMNFSEMRELADLGDDNDAVDYEIVNLDIINKPTTSRNLEPLNKNDIQNKIIKQIPEKSLENAKWACNAFNHWIYERNIKILNSGSLSLMFLSDSGNGHSTLDTLSETQLNEALQYFIFEVRKKDGSPYPSNSLRQLVCGLNYWLKFVGNKDWKLLTNSAFSGSIKALDAAMKESAKNGVNSKPKRASPITTEQEEALWNRGYLGDDNPKKLNRTLLYLLSIHCGLRGGRELRQLTYGSNGSISLVTQNDGAEVIEYNEPISKTNNHGVRQHHIEPKSVRIWPSENNPRCPIRLFKKMIGLRPIACSSDALFLQACPNFTNTKWYNTNPMGHNVLSMTFRSLMEAAGEDGNYTNQSGRRTTVTRIMETTGDKQLAKRITGHRSDCVEVYNNIPEKRLKMASNILSNSNITQEISSSSTTSSVVEIQSNSSTSIDNENGLAEFCKSLNITPKKLSIQRADGTNITLDF